MTVIVGKNNSCCPSLNVHGKEMKRTNQEKYLGEILTSDAKIHKNIQERYNKGIGIGNQIISMLKEVSFGVYYFEMAMLFRNSMLINGILCSIESVYGLTNTHIEQLEQCDRILMRKIFNSVCSTATEATWRQIFNLCASLFFICMEEDNQQHLLLCKKTTLGVDLEGVQYEDIFSSIKKQVKIAKI